MAAVLVVTYNNLGSVPELFATLKAWTAGGEDRVAVVIDNDSTDGTAAAVVSGGAGQDRIAVVSNERNVGFSPAVNQAFRTCVDRFGAPGEIVLLNPDVEANASMIEACIRSVTASGAAIVGPLLLDQDGQQDRGCARRNWNLRLLFAEIAGLPRSARWLGSKPRSIRLQPETGRHPVDITSGAFMVLQRSVFEPGLDERFPMYFEDQEICIRARASGQSVLVDSDIVAVHRGAESSPREAGARRDLRLMELAAAPVAAWQLATGGAIFSARLTVGIAGLTRWLAAASALVLKGRSGPHRQWARDQLELSGWFISWARHPEAELRLPS